MSDANNKENIGMAGYLAKAFVNSKLTPISIIVSLLLGLGAVYLTPKEEEPQIIVPMIDVVTPAPGLEAEEVERTVTEVIERAVSGLDGVEYVYSVSQPHGSLTTVRFLVGENLEDSLIKVHHKLLAIRHLLPKGTGESSVKSHSIDDVPFLTLTFSSNEKDDYELRQVVAPLARELSSTPNLNDVELLGGRKRSIRIVADIAKMKSVGVNLFEIQRALQANKFYFPVGKDWKSSHQMDIEVGARFTSKEDIESVYVSQSGGQVVRIRDVAKVIDGPEFRSKSTKLVKSDGAVAAVTLVFSKKKGTNVVDLSEDLLHRAKTFKKAVPADVKMDVTRNYGESAKHKSFELIFHLLLATGSVAFLIALVMGVRASIIVSIAIPVTLALTLAIYYFLGYTLNRVTLFALIFSIGILVDDAIVVVENIERHLGSRPKGKTFLKTVIEAVIEVGNPTVLATITVVAAILPMAFVRGLMGPYMAPIPIGASIAMIFSLIVAFMITPWASVRILKDEHHGDPDSQAKESKMDALYRKFIDMFLTYKKKAALFMMGVLVLFVGSLSLVYFKGVRVKMLPFDNKKEFQVLLDYPTGTSLEQSEKWSVELADRLVKHGDVDMVQVYTGEPAPFSFSGMVKHTFLRRADYLSDLQVVLKEKGDRKNSSHEVINLLRPTISKFAQEKNAISKVLEIPPGPPVLATMVAEIYGPDDESRLKLANRVHGVFNDEPSVVDLDYTWREGRARNVYHFDQQKGGLLGAQAQQLAMLGVSTFSENYLFNLDKKEGAEEIPVYLSLDNSVRSSDNPFDGQVMKSFDSGLIEVKDVLGEKEIKKSKMLHRKNLRRVEYVMSELTGEDEAPVYGMLNIQPKLSDVEMVTADVPSVIDEPIIKWDGEWFITYEVFRDLGGAFAVVMVLIYILVVGWFRSFLVPFVIMAPIPISLIGILPAHAMVDSFFTATSMIGFIAGAGIIVRNSIILVDFMEHQMRHGHDLKEAVISAGVLRFRPMLLTAAAVVVGSSVMLADPIFQGLAISLISGEVAATLLSRMMIPILYYYGVGRMREKLLKSGEA